MMTQKNGPNQWSGRFWLPAGDRVDPTHKFCLIRGDGRLGEMIVDRFALGPPNVMSPCSRAIVNSRDGERGEYCAPDERSPSE